MTGNQLKEIIRKSGLTQELAAQKMGITRRTLQNWFKMDQLDANISQIVKNVGFSTGESYDEIVVRRGHSIRFWDNIEATGGGIMSFDDVKESYTELVLPDFRDCTDAMKLVGDSMYPRYKSGQIIIFREWQENFIEFGQTYLIITKTGYRMVKYIYPSEKKGHVSCVSENSETFPAFDVDQNDIHKIFLVKGSIEQNTF